MIVTAYPRIHFDTHLRQHKKHIACLFVVLKATEGRKTHPRIWLFQGYSFEVAEYSAVTSGQCIGRYVNTKSGPNFNPG